MALPQTYTSKEVAAALKCNVKTLGALVARTPEVTPARLSDAANGELRFTEDDVEKLLQAMRGAPAVAPVRKRRRGAPPEDPGPAGRRMGAPGWPGSKSLEQQ